MGASFYTVWFVLSLYFLASLVSQINAACKFKAIERYLRWVWKKLPVSVVIRIFLELNFTLLISTYLQIVFITQTTSWVDVLSNILAVLSAALCLFVPTYLFLVICVLKKHNLLHLKKTKKRYGAIYSEFLWNSPTMCQLSYYVLFMVRRSATFFSIFFMA